MRRLLSPLAAAEVTRSLERSHERLSDQPLDLAPEAQLEIRQNA